MAGGGGSASTTQRQEPPAYAAPFLGEAAQRAQWEYYDDFNRGYYPGQTVVGFSPETEQSLQGITSRATQGSAVTDAAQNLASSVMGRSPTSQYGSGSNPWASGANPFGDSSNPYLDATFNKAADSVQNRLATQFAGSGRNIGASRAANASELNDLATNLYGGAYENERNRQLQYGSQQLGIGAQGYELERDRMANDLNQQRQQQLAYAGMAPQLASQDYADLDRLSQVGAVREDLTGRQYEDAAARYDFAQGQHGLALDQYIQRLQGMPGSSISSNTPIYRNYGAGALGGAMAGQQIGSGIGSGYGGWGAGIGALVGLLGS